MGEAFTVTVPLQPSSGAATAPSTDVETLVLENLPLVHYVVNEFAVRLPGHVDRADLESAGNTGLVQAAQSYNPDLGVPFKRWANQRVRGAILDELRGMDWATRSVRRQARDIATTTTRLTNELGRAPGQHEVADALGMNVADLDRQRAMSERVVLSLDIDEGSAAIAVPDEAPNPADHVVMAEQYRHIHAAVQMLPERLREVVVAVYLEQRPMAELATQWNVTESRISQLRAEGVVLLQSAMAALDNEFGRIPQPRQSPRKPDGAAQRKRNAYVANVVSAVHGR